MKGLGHGQRPVADRVAHPRQRSRRRAAVALMVPESAKLSCITQMPLLVVRSFPGCWQDGRVVDDQEHEYAKQSAGLGECVNIVGAKGGKWSSD
jgi:hypothetical protein